MSLTPGIRDFLTSDELYEQVLSLYDNTTVDLILKALPQTLPNFSKVEFAEWIRDWAAAYLYAKKAMDHKIPGATKRKNAENLIRSTDALLECINGIPSSIYQSILFQWPNLAHKNSGLFGPPANYYAVDLEITRALRTLSSLRQATEQFEANLSIKRGAQRKISRHLAVGALGYEYHAATGEMPTRRYDAYKEKPYGPFRDFVVAAFRPIEGDQAEKGIGRVIQEVLTRRD